MGDGSVPGGSAHAGCIGIQNLHDTVRPDGVSVCRGCGSVPRATPDTDGAPPAHQGHNHNPVSSATHLTLDLHCLVAILPGAAMLLWICLDRLYLSILLFKLAIPAFLRSFLLKRSHVYSIW